MVGPAHRGPDDEDGASRRPIVITRPRDDARKLADELRALGREVILAPVLDIRPVAFDISVPRGTDGLIVTSANGADALGLLDVERTTPVWAVGGATGARARTAGFEQVKHGGGTAADLIEVLKRETETKPKKLLWLSGEDIRVDLATALSGHGVAVERRIVYAAVEVKRFDDDLLAALRATQEADIVFFSPRSACRFVRVLAETGELHHISRWRAVCFSGSIADALVGETTLEQVDGRGETAAWSEVIATAAPTRDALMSALCGDSPAGLVPIGTGRT